MSTCMLRCAAASAVLLVASTAHASERSEVALVVGVGMVIGNGYAVVHNISGAPVSGTYAVVETIFTAPQAIVFSALAADAMLGSEPDPALGAVATGLAALTGALATHGIWSLANRDKPSNEILAVSLIASVDASFLAATTLAYSAGLSPRPLGIGALFFAGPAAIGATYGLLTDRDHRTGWITLTAASSALFVHGVFATIFGSRAPTPAPIATPGGRVVPGLAWSTFF